VVRFRKRKLKELTKYSKHEVAEPLYNVEQARKVFPHFKVINTDEVVPLDAEISAIFVNAGHIIGACSIELTIENKTLVFQVILVEDNDVLMYYKAKRQIMCLESTYGDLHPESDPKLELEMYINNTFKMGGTVFIPSFAVERAQMIMYLLWQLREEGKILTFPLWIRLWGECF
jgi:metallo-beta-lactamase family protein